MFGALVSPSLPGEKQLVQRNYRWAPFVAAHILTRGSPAQSLLADYQSLNVRIPRRRAVHIVDGYDIIYESWSEERQKRSHSRCSCGKILKNFFVGFLSEESVICYLLWAELRVEEGSVEGLHL
jgi:hypothetical protein